MGNNPENKRGVYAALSFVRPDPEHEQEDFHREAERRTGKSLSPSEASSYWMRSGLAWIAEHPGAALALDVRKLGLFLHRYEEPDNEDIDFWGRYSPWLRYNPLRFGVIAPIALVGLALGWPRRRRLSLLYLVLGAYTLSVSLFFVLARYRLPAVSLLLVFAAGALVELFDAWRERKRKVFLVAAVAAVPALLVVHHPSAEESGPMSPGMYTNLGMAYLNDGRIPDALAAQREAVRLAPGWADARYNLANVLYRSGNRAEALTELREVVRLNPDYAEAWSYIGNLLEEEDRLDDSAEALRTALRLQPGRPEHLYNLARVLGELHRSAETDSLLRVLYRLRDSQYSIEGKLIEAKLLAETGEKGRAAKILREYIAVRPQSPMRPQLETSIRNWEQEGSNPPVPSSSR
jgi:tetratricopeptide (TPR) repeat protein